jgi:hypothetical protein
MPPQPRKYRTQRCRRLLRLLHFALTISSAGRGAGASPGRQSSLWKGNGTEGPPIYGEGLGRLPDFSFAGYQAGMASLPDVSAQNESAQFYNVKEFGALGNGRHDDTEAFLRAMDSARSPARSGHFRVVLIPPGVFVLSRRITIDRSRIVLKGLDPNERLCFF